MKAVEAQNEVLKLTQYDRALAMMKAQKELFDNERASLEKRIADLNSSGKDQTAEITKLNQQIVSLDVKRGINTEQLLQMLMMMQASTKETFPPPPPPPSDAGSSVNVRIRR